MTSDRPRAGGDAQQFAETIAADHESVYRGVLLERRPTPYQHLEIYDHAHYGRVLVLDQMVQTTEQDEFCYHEMLVHPALSSLERAGRVLIVGGGDGGTLRRVLEHGAEVVMVEIDRDVTEASRRHLPSVSSGAFDDPRATVLFEDGVAYIQSRRADFDAIVIDSTEPVGPAVALFSEAFYADCRRALRPGGVVVTQSGSPLYRVAELENAVTHMAAVFGSAEVYTGLVPTYPGVVWSYLVGSDAGPVSQVPQDVIAGRLQERGVRTRYYTPALHPAAFALPAFIADVVRAAASSVSRR